jgi:hypothetical protein
LSVSHATRRGVHLIRQDFSAAQLLNPYRRATKY